MHKTVPRERNFISVSFISFRFNVTFLQIRDTKIAIKLTKIFMLKGKKRAWQLSCQTIAVLL